MGSRLDCGIPIGDGRTARVANIQRERFPPPFVFIAQHTFLKPPPQIIDTNKVSACVRCSSYSVGLQLLHGDKHAGDAESHAKLLKEVTALLQQCFEPIRDPDSGNDLIPLMVRAQSELNPPYLSHHLLPFMLLPTPWS